MNRWTDDQLDAINTTDKGVIVSAAAGSGKTAVLIERTIRLLCDENKKIPVEKLLAVTFTNDAASQMREKLYNAFNSKIQEEPENEWIQQQQMKLQMAKISTINSFCFDLVKNNIDMFDLSNGVRILDETESKTILSECLEEVLENNYTDNYDMMNNLNKLFCGSTDKELYDIILQIYNFSRSLPFKDKWFDDVSKSFHVESNQMKDWQNELISYIEESVQLVYNSVVDANKTAQKLKYYDGTKKVINSDVSVISSIISKLKCGDIFEISEFLSKIKFDKYSSKLNKGAPENCEIEKAEVTFLKDVRDGYKDEIKKITALCSYNKENLKDDLVLSGGCLDWLMSLVNQLEEKVWSVKTEKNAIDFADVEILSIRLLADETEDGYERTKLAKEIQSLYDIILIDEYQDVNNLQDIIFKCISQSDNPALLGNNMFVVGDVKQSIYRFRMANPNIFIDTQKKAQNKENNIKEIKLKKNFRSRKNIIDFVNYIFKDIMSVKAGEIDYNKDEALDCGALYDGKSLSTEILIVNNNGTSENDEITDESEIVAKRISQMISDKVMVYDNNISRPCTQKDFCILVRTNSNNKKIVANLKEYGLSAKSEELSGYLRSREISVLISMLTIIDNPMNDMSMASVLLSPIFSFNDDEVGYLKAYKKNCRLYSVMLDLCDDKKNKTAETNIVDKCKSAVAVIKKLRFYASGVTLERLIRKIYDDTDFLSVVSVYKDGVQKKANLRLLLEYANSYDNSISGGLSGFIRYINTVFKNGGDLKQAGIVTGEADSVTIKTIHKSKGLEYPFVFLCYSSTQFTMQKRDLTKRVITNLYSGIAFRFKDKKNLISYTTLPYDAIRNRNYSEMLSEEMRLLYVALTRAKEKLFITYNCKKNAVKNNRTFALEIKKSNGVPPSLVKKANCMQDWITMSLINYDKDNFIKEMYADDVKMVLKSCESQIDFILPDDIKETEYNEIEERDRNTDNKKEDKNIEHYINYNYDKSLSYTLAKISVSEIAKKDNEDYFFQLPVIKENDKNATGAEIGTATHTFMQFADFRKAEINILDEIKRVKDKGLITERQADLINTDSVRAFFDSNIYKRMSNSNNVMREKQFEIMISDLDIDMDELSIYNNTSGLLQGIADCVFEEDDGYVLLDYKTDSVKTADELTEKYSTQLMLYKKAFDMILDKPVKESYIYSFKLKSAIKS